MGGNVAGLPRSVTPAPVIAARFDRGVFHPRKLLGMARPAANHAPPGSPMAIFTCDSCSHEMATLDSHIGRSAKCPKCRQTGKITPDAPAQQEDIAPEHAAEESPPASHAPAHAVYAEPPLPVWAAGIIAAAFTALGLSTIGGALLFAGAIAAANSAPQEAAAGAIFASFFIAGYTTTRSVEKVVRAIAQR